MTRILGIDPGSQRTGVGIIDVDASGKVTHVHHQPLVLLGAESFPLRLRRLLDGLWALIERHAPDEVAVEQVFLSNNAMSALKLGQARGAAIAAKRVPSPPRGTATPAGHPHPRISSPTARPLVPHLAPSASARHLPLSYAGRLQERSWRRTPRPTAPPVVVDLIK